MVLIDSIKEQEKKKIWEFIQTIKDNMGNRTEFKKLITFDLGTESGREYRTYGIEVIYGELDIISLSKIIPEIDNPYWTTKKEKKLCLPLTEIVVLIKYIEIEQYPRKNISWDIYVYYNNQWWKYYGGCESK